MLQDILGFPVQSKVSLPICIVVAYEYMSMVLSVSQNQNCFAANGFYKSKIEIPAHRLQA